MLHFISGGEIIFVFFIILMIFGADKIPEIAAASIIAKVSRDRLIKKISKNFIGYAWEKNAGYGTKKHLIAIKKLGITKYHR